MAEKGFAIHCPHCLKWNIWKGVHPKKVTLNSKEELAQILSELKSAALRDEPDSFSHPKLLRCKNSRWLCPASFEAFICKSEKEAVEFLKVAKAWSFKRDFRLAKADCKNRWQNKKEGKYYGILFCTQPVLRQRDIGLELLINRDLLSRVIVGMSYEMQVPITVYALNVFERAGEGLKRYWMPIEAYSRGKQLVPAGYNEFCHKCRKLVTKQIETKFLSKNVKPSSCPIGFGFGDECAGRKAACLKGDWNYCPAFIEERMKWCPCYKSDCEFIETIEKDLKASLLSGKALDWKSKHKCYANFEERGISIVVHNHLVGVAMFGQMFFDPEDIVDIDMFCSKYEKLKGHEKELAEAKHRLISREKGLRKEKKSRFFVSESELDEKLDLLHMNIKEVADMANSRYSDFRSRSESMFRQEILGYIQNHKKDKVFWDKHIVYVLDRMREFWAFRAVCFVVYSFKTKDISVVAFSMKDKQKSFGIPGKKKGYAEVSPQQMHPCPYLHQRGQSVPRYNPLLKELLLIFEGTSRDSELGIPDGKCYFYMLIPSSGEVDTFVFAVRDEDIVGRFGYPIASDLSKLGQDAIAKTCNEVVHELSDVRYHEASKRAWREFSALASHRIGNEISSVGTLLDVLSDQLMMDSGWAEKWGGRLSVMQKCVKSAKRMLTEQTMLEAEINLQLKVTNLESLMKRAATGVLPADARLSFTGSMVKRDIRVDLDLMEQVFKELCINAVRAAGEAVELIIEAIEDAGKLCISFSDNGPGIPTEDSERIFEPYVSLSHSGRGLGLATVRKVVEAHGGAVCIGESDEGAKFVITLPMKRVQE